MTRFYYNYTGEWAILKGIAKFNVPQLTSYNGALCTHTHCYYYVTKLKFNNVDEFAPTLMHACWPKLPMHCSQKPLNCPLFVQGTDLSTSLLTFANAIGAIWNIVLQTTGELDTNKVFVDTRLLYPVLTYILLVLFIIAMPVLFNNFLVSAIMSLDSKKKILTFMCIVAILLPQ